MNDRRKFLVLAVFTVLLAAGSIASSVFGEYFRTEIFDYLKRKAYYEKSIAPKGLDLHKGMYWQEKE